MEDAAIQTLGLSKDYGAGRGIFDLNLEVKRGEIFGFLGPNGSGKTTTMRVLLSLIKATAGSAQVLGYDIVKDSIAIRQHSGYLAGDFGLYPKLTGRKLLKYFAELDGSADIEYALEIGDVLSAELDSPIRKLSTGNRQKIGLIQALMHKPELLILDEPITGLDPLVQSHFHELLLGLKEEGHTIFLSSHTLSEVEQIADRVGILRKGKLTVVDTLENLRSVALQKLEVEFSTPPVVELFSSLDGVEDAALQGKRMSITFKGSPDRLIKTLAEYDVVSIHTHEADLEEVFLRYYSEEGQ